jgi:hypothetical protein
MLIDVQKNLMEGRSNLSLVLKVETKDIMQIIVLRQLNIMGTTMGKRQIHSRRDMSTT